MRTIATIFLLLVYLNGYAQISTTFDNIFRQGGGRGLSQRNYRNADSIRVRWAGMRSDVIFVSKYNPSADYTDLPAAYAALPAWGGTIQLDNIRPGGTAYTGSFTILKPNVAIIGTFSPILSDADTLVGASARIQGRVNVFAGGFVTERVAYMTTVTADDCLAMQPPNFLQGGTTDGTNHVSGARINDCAFIGKSRDALFHGLRVEDYTDVVMTNITTLNNVHGIALKANNLKLDGFVSKNHDYEGVIVKADFQKTVDGIQVANGRVSSTSIAGGTYPGSTVTVQNYSNASTLKNVTLSNISLKNAWLRFDNASTNINGVIDVQANNVSIDNQLGSMYSVLLTGSQNVGLVTLSNLNIKSLLAAPIYDASKVFTNVRVVNFNSNKALSANLVNNNRALGTRFVKSAVVSGTATSILDVAYDINTTNDYFGCYLVTISAQGATAFGSATFLVNFGYNNATVTQIAFAGSNVAGGSQLTAMTLTATPNASQQKVTLAATQTNVSANNMTLHINILPLSTGNEIRFTPL